MGGNGLIIPMRELGIVSSCDSDAAVNTFKHSKSELRAPFLFFNNLSFGSICTKD